MIAHDADSLIKFYVRPLQSDFLLTVNLSCVQIDSQELGESNGVSIMALSCIDFKLAACENSAEVSS